MSVQARAAAVIVAAGSGTRFGDGAKVLARIGGQPLISWVLQAIEESLAVRESILVTGAHTDAVIRQLIADGPWSKPVTLVPGAESRQRSVAAGVDAVPQDLSIVLVHDAARPMVMSGDFDRCADAASASGAAIVAIPVPDTLKRVENGWITSTVPRAGLWAAQTPQGFDRVRLTEACAIARAEDREFTDEASIFEYLGWPVAIVRGSQTNLKITHSEDLALAEALLSARCATLKRVPNDA